MHCKVIIIASYGKREDSVKGVGFWEVYFWEVDSCEVGYWKNGFGMFGWPWERGLGGTLYRVARLIDYPLFWKVSKVPYMPLDIRWKFFLFIGQRQFWSEKSVANFPAMRKWLYMESGYPWEVLFLLTCLETPTKWERFFYFSIALCFLWSFPTKQMGPMIYIAVFILRSK